MTRLILPLISGITHVRQFGEAASRDASGAAEGFKAELRFKVTTCSTNLGPYMRTMVQTHPNVPVPPLGVLWPCVGGIWEFPKSGGGGGGANNILSSRALILGTLRKRTTN